MTLPSIANQVRRYIDRRPVILAAMKKGLINHSALARQIQDETGLPSINAILAASRRFQRGLKVDADPGAIRELLSRSRIETRSPVAIIVIDRRAPILSRLSGIMQDLLKADQLFRLDQVATATIVVVAQDALMDVVELLDPQDVLDIRIDLVEIAVTGPATITETPGILAYLTTRLAEAEINLIQVVSCHRDTIVVIEQDQVGRAVAVLDRLVGKVLPGHRYRIAHQLAEARRQRDQSA